MSLQRSGMHSLRPLEVVQAADNYSMEDMPSLQKPICGQQKMN